MLKHTQTNLGLNGNGSRSLGIGAGSEDMGIEIKVGSHINIFMLKFKEFLSENFLVEGKYIFGVNHTDRNADKAVLDIAKSMGYVIREGGSHMKIFDPFDNSLVTIVSRGGAAAPGRHRNALSDLQAHQRSIGGFDGQTDDEKSIKRAMRKDPNASRLVSREESSDNEGEESEESAED